MFKAATVHSNKIKALFEVLFSNISPVCLIIDKEGIRSEIVTNQNVILVFSLPADKFDEYIYTFPEPQYIGLGNHVNSFLKLLKNKTKLLFSIVKEKPFILDISIRHEDDYEMTFSANTEMVQNQTPIELEPYQQDGIEISSIHLNQLCKSFKGPLVDVTKKNGQISFSVNLLQISSKTITFGKEYKDDYGLYFKEFKTDSFNRLSKLSSFVSENVKIYIDTNCPKKPLMIEGKSLIGTIKIYIKEMS